MEKTIRDEEVQKNYLDHLNRVRGQIEGIMKMVQNDEYCLDIINQINAIRGSLLAINKKLINEHIDHCVRHSQDIDHSLEEIKALVDKLAK